MKKIFILACLILAAHSLSAQVISYDMIQRNANTDVKLTLKDSKSSDPIPKLLFLQLLFPLFLLQL